MHEYRFNLFNFHNEGLKAFGNKKILAINVLKIFHFRLANYRNYGVGSNYNGHNNNNDVYCTAA